MHPYVQTKSCGVQELRANTFIISQGVVNGKKHRSLFHPVQLCQPPVPSWTARPFRADPAAEHPPTSRSCGRWNNGPLESSERSFAFIGVGSSQLRGAFLGPASPLAIPRPAPSSTT